MATKELSILIRARDMASKTIAGVRKEVGSLGRIGSQAMKGLSTAITRVGIAAGVGLVGAIGMGVRSLADLQRTTAQTNAVIASTGGKAKVTAAQVRQYSNELENLTTVDDKVIQDGQNMLLTFTGISGKIFPRATAAALNLAVAMAKGDVAQVDMQASAIQVGKALNDPIKGVTALRKVGVSFTEQQLKQIKVLVKTGDTLGAQKIILKELETEFGKAGAAAGTGPAAAWRRLQDAGEGASQSLAKGLLPVMERAAKWLSTKMADPAVIASIDALGAGLADAATQAMNFVEKVDFKSIGAGLQVAAGAAGTIVSAFMAMPEWVKIAVVSGWGLNKLTGGALGSIIGEVGKGLIKGVLGMNAGVVNIKAGAVTGVGGGLPGAAGGGKVAGLASLASKVFLVGAAVGVFAELKGILDEQSGRNQQQAADLGAQTQGYTKVAGVAEMQAALAGIEAQQRMLNTSVSAEGFAYQLNIDGVRDAVNAQTSALKAAIATQLEPGPRRNSDGIRPGDIRGRTSARLDPRVLSELGAVGKFTASTGPSFASMKAHLGALETLQRSSGVRDSANASAIVSAIASLKSVMGNPPSVVVNVTARAVQTATVIRGRHNRPSLVRAGAFTNRSI